MKYTIELTNKQKAQMDCIIDIVHRYVGFNPKLEMDIPLPMKESPAYKKGFEDGKKQAIEEIPELADKENEIYNDGYNKGLEDAWKLIVAIETDREVEEEVFGEDLDYNFDNVSVQDAMKKWKAYEEKKQAEEESVKVGDIIYSDLLKLNAIITHDDGMSWRCIDTDGIGFTKLKDRLDEEWKKVGHTDDLAVLLAKVGGKE